MKKTKIISVINFKGGVGKSTITYNLASELAEDNKKILQFHLLFANKQFYHWKIL